MKQFPRLSVILFILAFFSFAAFAQDKTVDENDAKALREIYKEFDLAAIKGDIGVVEKYLDENYELENGERTLSRAEVIEQVKGSLMLVDFTESVSKIEKVEVAEGNYFLEVSSNAKGTIIMPDGKTAQFETIGKSTDIWIKTAAGWKEIRQIVRQNKMLIDGKEVRM